MNSGTPNLVLQYSFAPNFGEMVWVGVEFYTILMKWCKNWCGLEMLLGFSIFFGPLPKLVFLDYFQGTCFVLVEFVC